MLDARVVRAPPPDLTWPPGTRAAAASRRSPAGSSGSERARGRAPGRAPVPCRPADRGRADRRRRAAGGRARPGCLPRTERSCPGCGLRTSSAAGRGPEEVAVVAALVAQGLRAGGRGGDRAGSARTAGGRGVLTPHHTRRGILLGLFEEHSHRLVRSPAAWRTPRPSRPRSSPCAGRSPGSTRRSTTSESTPGWLRHVSVRASAATGDAVVVLVMTAGSTGRSGSLGRDPSPGDEHRGVVANVPPRGQRALRPGVRGDLRDRTPSRSPRAPSRSRSRRASFFQVNPAVAGAHAGRIERRRPGARGAGARPLAERGRRRVGAASRRGDGPSSSWRRPPPRPRTPRRTRKSHAPGRIEVANARVEDATGPSSPAALVVVVNLPERAGDKVRNALRERPPDSSFYVSCDPRSSPGMPRHSEHSPRLESVTPFDLMPQTPCGGTGGLAPQG